MTGADRSVMPLVRSLGACQYPSRRALRARASKTSHARWPAAGLDRDFHSSRTLSGWKANNTSPEAAGCWPKLLLNRCASPVNISHSGAGVTATDAKYAEGAIASPAGSGAFGSKRRSSVASAASPRASLARIRPACYQSFHMYNMIYFVRQIAQPAAHPTQVEPCIRSAPTCSSRY